jgi:hypothetical protein
MQVAMVMERLIAVPSRIRFGSDQIRFVIEDSDVEQVEQG